MKKLPLLICAGLLVIGTVELKTPSSVSEATTIASTTKSTNDVEASGKATAATKSAKPKQETMVEKQKKYCATAIPKNQAPKPVTTTTTKAKTALKAKPANKTVNSPTVSRGTARKSVEDIVREVGAGYWSSPAELDALVWIWKHESIRPGVVSKTGCKGLFQLKNPPKWMKLGDPVTESKAGCEYIKRRYKTPLKAKAFWLKHHWY